MTSKIRFQPGFMPIRKTPRGEIASRPSYFKEVLHVDLSTRTSTTSSMALWKPSTVPSTSATFPFIQLFLSFWLGGLVCSIILPRLAIVAWGAWQSLSRRISVLQRGGHGSGRDASKRRKGNRKWHPIDFRTVPRRSLVVFQYIAEHLVGLSFQTQLRRAFEQAISEVDNPNIRNIEVDNFKTQSTPRFQSCRIYDLGQKAMAFDADGFWNDACEASIIITTQQLGLVVPVRIHNVRFVGPVRIILTPLIEQPPGFGAVVCSFPRAPRLELDIDVAGGQITKVPWLKEELTEAIMAIIKKQMVWPNRIVNPSLQPNFNVTLIDSAAIDELGKMDPFLEAESEWTR